MIYNPRNQSNDAAESQKAKRPVLMLILVRITRLFKMRSLKCLAKGYTNTDFKFSLYVRVSIKILHS